MTTTSRRPLDGMLVLDLGQMEYTVDSTSGELFVVDPGVATPLAVGTKVAISFAEHSVTVVRR